MANTIKNNNQLDNHGLLTEQMPDSAPRYDFKAIREYCKATKKNLADLTEQEIKQFEST